MSVRSEHRAADHAAPDHTDLYMAFHFLILIFLKLMLISARVCHNDTHYLSPTVVD